MPKAADRETDLKEQQQLWDKVSERVRSAATLADEAKLPIHEDILQTLYWDLRADLQSILAKIELRK